MPPFTVDIGEGSLFIEEGLVVDVNGSNAAGKGLAHGIGLNERVSVPDGRVGSVIGFYCWAPETVLVHFESGDSREFAPAELQRMA